MKPTDVKPTQWGGWGHRGSLRLTRQAAVVIRRGPGLRLNLTRNRTFVVTVDDRAGAAAELDVVHVGPELVSDSLTTQTADVDIVSGATCTSMAGVHAFMVGSSSGTAIGQLVLLSCAALFSYPVAVRVLNQKSSTPNRIPANLRTHHATR